MPSQLAQLISGKETVGICVSGGLDSKTVALRLKQAGVKVRTYCADLGQPDEENINDVVTKMAVCGLDQPTCIVDLRAEMGEAAFEAIACQAKYDGGYWQSTGLGRHVTALGLLKEMKKQGCTVLSHVATGRGNDQVRFERYVNVLDDSFGVYAPWRDAVLLNEFPGRTEMLAYLKKHGIDHAIVSQAAKRYSTDANVCGLSNEAEDLESLETSMRIVNPVMGVWPHDAPNTPEKVEIAFKEGKCTSIYTTIPTKQGPQDSRGKNLTAFQLLQLANEIGGRNGLGLSQALENRIIGTKSRGVYEAPGMTLLGQALEHVYQAVLDRRSAALFKQLSSHVADQLYDGRYFDPSTRAAIGAIWALAKPASAVVTLELFKGSAFFVSLTGCEKSLYNEADASMEASEGLNPVSSQGFLEVASVEAKTLCSAGQISNRLEDGHVNGTANGAAKRRKV